MVHRIVKLLYTLGTHVINENGGRASASGRDHVHESAYDHDLSATLAG